MRHLWPLLFAACVPSDPPAGDDSALPGPVGDPATIPLAGTCPLESRIGGFEVDSYDSYAVVDGRVADSVLPISVLEPVQSAGECELLRRDNPFCDPACDSDHACDFDGTCVPYPVEQDLGTVTVAGLVAPVAMEPHTPGAHYFDTTLDNPPFQPDDLVELHAGDATLHGVGFSPVVPGEATWSIPDGEDLTLTWDVPTGLQRSEVSVRITIDQHGATPVTLACTFADDGEGVIPADLVTTLRASGISGFPNGTISRRTADRVDLAAGCMDFIVASPRNPDVRVDGSTPCDDPGDCPDGQTCDMELEICE